MTLKLIYFKVGGKFRTEDYNNNVFGIINDT